MKQVVEGGRVGILINGRPRIFLKPSRVSDREIRYHHFSLIYLEIHYL
jgi:hypothetical protein